MATDKEAAFPIEDWRGVNRNVNREDGLPNHLWTAQNLWENKLGELETRWGSTSLASPPSNVIKAMNPYTLYKKDGTKTRLCAVQCDPTNAVATNQITSFGNFPTGLTVSLLNDASGFWTNDNTIGGTTYSGKHVNLYIRLVGYGIDQWYTSAYTSVSGYSAATSQKLRVALSQALNSNITGIEVYVGSDMGQGATSAADSEMLMWVGFIDLIASPTGNNDFLYCPQGQSIARAIASGTERGELQRTFSYTAEETGGSLIGGKTYYVAVIPHHQIWSSTLANQRSCLRHPSVTPSDVADIVAITIPGTGTTGSIEIYSISLETVGFVVAIGESPYMLQPYKYYNKASTFVPAAELIVSSRPKGSPALFDYQWTAADVANITFRASDYSINDMLMSISDAGVCYPIFHSRQDSTVNTDAKIYPSQITTTYGLRGFSSDYYDKLYDLGKGSNYNYVTVGNILFFTNDFNVIQYPTQMVRLGFTSYHRTGTNYFQTDGTISGCVIEEYQTSAIKLPLFKYITYFDGSVILTGGAQTVDPTTNAVKDSRRLLYCSRALNPYDFTIAGAGSPTHFTLAVNEGEEDINGIGVYSNTSITTGPQTQLLISKKGSMHVLNAIPSVSSGAISDYSIQMISRRAGGAGHNCIVNTPVGTVVVGVDNVFLIRGNGEPAPIGQEISSILKGGDLTYGFACYHDRHVKISFFHSDWSGTSGQNNVEFWLNVNKMIEGKGQSDWVGPMVGRSVQSCFVEDKAVDGLIYNSARDRIVCDGTTVRVYKADVTPAESDTQILDFATAVTAEIETVDLIVSQQDNNWNKLLKRSYWKIRTNKTSGSPLTGTHTLYVDGASFEAKAVSFYANASANFSAQPLKLNSVFHTGRARGRTFRHKFSTAYRVGIAGLQMNYQIERRRID